MCILIECINLYGNFLYHYIRRSFLTDASELELYSCTRTRYTKGLTPLNCFISETHCLKMNYSRKIFTKSLLLNQGFFNACTRKFSAIQVIDISSNGTVQPASLQMEDILRNGKLNLMIIFCYFCLII